MLGYLYVLRHRGITQINKYRLPVDGSYTQEVKEQGEEKLDCWYRIWTPTAMPCRNTSAVPDSSDPIRKKELLH